MFDTIYMMLSFIDDVKKEVENKNGFIDKFRFEFNSIYRIDDDKNLIRQQAPVLLPEEKTGETMKQYLENQKKINSEL